MTQEYESPSMSSSSESALPHRLDPLELHRFEQGACGGPGLVPLSELSSHFLSMLSHELRTPLTPALAAIALLRRLPELTQESRELVELVARNVAMEAQLIDDLLDVTALQRGHLHLERRPVGLQALVAGAVQDSRAAAAGKGITLLHDAYSNEYYIQGDASRISDVFSRLLGNAIKFTQPGGSITVRSWEKDARILFEIRDSGIGFEPANAERLFDVFHQVGKGPSRTSGLGLGLAICKGIVELHGGVISASSSGVGAGACFVVTLPTLADSELVSVAEAQECIEVTEIATVSRQRLLLVEDHADTAEILTMLLEEQGYVVVAADSVAGALNVNLADIDLVISDIGLPDGTGTDLLRQLKSKRVIPAIALSGFGMDSDVEDSIQAGFDCHLTKPVDFDHLLKSVRALLKTTQAVCVAAGQAGS